MPSEPHEIDLAGKIEELQRNSEAGSVLVTAAIMDDWLQRLLLAAMRPLSNNVAERIFGSAHPLCDIAPKADIAFAFNLIDQQTLKNIRAVKGIRDLFAHTRDLIDFSTVEVIDECGALPGFKKGADCHELFNVTAVDIIEAINRKIEELIYKHSVANQDGTKS